MIQAVFELVLVGVAAAIIGLVLLTVALTLDVLRDTDDDDE